MGAEERLVEVGERVGVGGGGGAGNREEVGSGVGERVLLKT